FLQTGRPVTSRRLRTAGLSDPFGASFRAPSQAHCLLRPTRTRHPRAALPSVFFLHLPPSLIEDPQRALGGESDAPRTKAFQIDFWSFLPYHPSHLDSPDLFQSGTCR